MSYLASRTTVVDDLLNIVGMSPEEYGAFMDKVYNCIVVKRRTRDDGLSSSQIESAYQEVWVLLEYLRTVLSMTPDQIVEFLDNKNLAVDLHNIRSFLDNLQTEMKMSTEDIVASFLPSRTHG